jgi:hypothetical protein
LKFLRSDQVTKLGGVKSISEIVRRWLGKIEGWKTFLDIIVDLPQPFKQKEHLVIDKMRDFENFELVPSHKNL